MSITPEDFNGRPIISPNQFAEKFTVEFGTANAETELILFLDGNEKNGLAVEADETTFANTWTRPKWHIVNDFIVSK